MVKNGKFNFTVKNGNFRFLLFELILSDQRSIPLLEASSGQEWQY